MEAGLPKGVPQGAYIVSHPLYHLQSSATDDACVRPQPAPCPSPLPRACIPPAPEPAPNPIVPRTHTPQPFGAGPRVCLGLRFALVEALAVTAVLLKLVRLSPVDPRKELDVYYPAAMSFRGGVPVVVEGRK